MATDQLAIRCISFERRVDPGQDRFRQRLVNATVAQLEMPESGMKPKYHAAA
jgi:hypothetical protein